MSESKTKTFRRSWRHCVQLAVLALFMAHALVPAGYMPNFGALRDGVIEVVICTGAEFKTLSVDKNGTPVNHNPVSPDSHLDKFSCPFSAAAVQKATPADAPPLLTSPSARVAADWVVITTASPRLPQRGSVLGSRAPPTNLG